MEALLADTSSQSAGGHLSALVTFHLIRSRPHFYFRGVFFNFGAFDLTYTPSVYSFKQHLVLWKEIMDAYIQALLPNMSAEQLKDPSVSPLYADLNALATASVHRALPPAFFGVGTADCLLDDTLFFSQKWTTSGSEAIVKVYPGGPHGLIAYDRAKFPLAGESQDDLSAWLKEKVATA